MLFNDQLQDILPNFSETEQDYILNLVDFGSLDLSPEDKYILLKIIRTIDENSSQTKKDYIIDIFEKIFVRDNPPNFYIINAGEDFTLTIRKTKSQDFTGSELLIRNAADGSALSPLDNDGDNTTEQTITITDLSLASDDFYKLNVVTEAPNGQGDASGDVLNLLDQIYMYVGEDVDTI